MTLLATHTIYVASSDRMILSRELERLWKEKTGKSVLPSSDSKVLVQSNSVM